MYYSDSVFEIKATFDQVSTFGADDTYAALLTLMNNMRTEGEWVESLKQTVYGFQAGPAYNITSDILKALVSADVETETKGQVWVEVATSALDEDVPEDWPKSTITETDDDGNETTTNRTLREYTYCIEGDNDTALVVCGYYYPISGKCFNSTSRSTTTNIALYMAEFSDSDLYFLDTKTTWVSDNVTTEETA